MASNSTSIAWLLPFMTLAPMGLVHCMASTEGHDSPGMDETPDSAPMMAPPDGGPKTQDDSGMKTQADSGMKTQGDSGMKTQGDESSKQPGDGSTPTAGDSGPAT